MPLEDILPEDQKIKLMMMLLTPDLEADKIIVQKTLYKKSEYNAIIMGYIRDMNNGP